MPRRRPRPQDEAVQLNASVPLSVKDRLREEADNSRLSVSAYLTKLLREKFAMN